MSETAELLERFRRGAELMASMLTGVAGAEVDFHPAPDRWSVRQIVAHVADAEMVAADRFRRTIAEENPSLIGYDQNAWAEKLDYHKRKPSQSLESFRRVRMENYELLKDLPAEAFARIAHHSEHGPLTLLELLKTYAEHPEKHAQQIRTVREQFKKVKAAGQL